MTTASLARGPPMEALNAEASDSDISPRRSLRSASRKPSEMQAPIKVEPLVYSTQDPDSPVDFSSKGSVEREGSEGGKMEPPEGDGAARGGRTFVCDICFKNFSNAANMRRHRIRHSGVKPFECKFCQKKFFRKDHMREHMAHKHNTVQLECYFCQEGFEKEKDLIQHVIHAHNVNSRELHCHICAFSAPTIGRYLWHLSNSHPRKQITYHAYNGPSSEAVPTMTIASAMPKISKVFSRKRRAVEEPRPPMENGDAEGEDSGSSVKQEDELAENNAIPPALPDFGSGQSVKYVSLLNPRMLDGGGEGNGAEGNVYLLVSNDAASTGQANGNGGAEWKASTSRRKSTMPVRRVHSPTADDPSPGHGAKREHPDSDTEKEADPVPAPPSASGTEPAAVQGKLQEHKCPYCLIVYPDNVMYLLHKMLHSRQQPYKCAVCQHEYPNRYEFYAHIVNHRP